MRKSAVVNAFIFVLLTATSLAAASAEPDYYLDASIDVKSSRVSGVARVKVRAGEEVVLDTGRLTVQSMTLGGEKTAFDPNRRITAITPEDEGILEIRYTGRFREVRSSRSRDDRVAPNVIDERGVSLTGSWYPQVRGLRQYEATVTLPPGYEAISEADRIEKTETGAETRFSFHFPYPVDGINLVASNRFRVIKDMVGDIELYAYFFEEDEKLAGNYLEFTRRYLKLYEDLLGNYPFRRFSVVENFLPTGYSMPTFTLLGSTVVRLPFIVETSLGHEILHQWFGNALYIDLEQGNWAEGLTSYLADHLYEEQKGKGWQYRKQILVDYKSHVTEDNEFALKDFVGRVDFSSRSIGYGKTAMFFHMLRQKMGDSDFFDGLRTCIRDRSFSRVSWDDLRGCFEAVSGEDLKVFFDQWVKGKGLPRLEVGKLEVRQAGSEFLLTFVVNQKEKIYGLDLPMTVYMEEGVKREVLSISGKSEDFEFLFPYKPRRVVFDEDYDVARDLIAEEFPPVIARLLGERDLLVALPSRRKRDYSRLIEDFKKRGAESRKAKNISDADLRESAVVILGHDNPLVDRLFGKVERPRDGFAVEIRNNPWNPRKVAAIISGTSKEEISASSGKLRHYGKYSRLHFEGGRNILKETKESDRGISMDTHEEAVAIDLSTIRSLRDVIDGVSGKKIIYVGEVHDVFGHHAVQLDIITGIHQRTGKVAIGMEMFQRPFQKTLDTFVAGRMGEVDFLKKSEYFRRWGFDYHLYKPILDFARTEKIPVIALNIQREIINKVSREGIDSLSGREKKDIPPDMDFADESYRERLAEIFRMHGDSSHRTFDYFYQSQILWDETMSLSIVEFLEENPDFQIVVLAGRGHLEYGSGIPVRTHRRNGQPYSIVLIDSEVENGIADYVVFPKPVEGITTPKLMVFLKEEEGRLLIAGFPEKSVSQKAGLREGDIILSLDEESIRTIEDIKIYLLYKRKGDMVMVKVRRNVGGRDKDVDIEVKL